MSGMLPQQGLHGGVHLTLRDLQATPSDELIGLLTRSVGAGGISQHDQAQIEAWHTQIELLRSATLTLTDVLSDCLLIFEFDIPRRGKRIDTVLLLGGLIVVMEFKVGANRFNAEAIRQVEDYALELADFHEPSHGKTIVPVVVATGAGPFEQKSLALIPGEVQAVVRVPGCDLGEWMQVLFKASLDHVSPGDHTKWIAGAYKPTPTILEAAGRLYAGHGVESITHSEAGVQNLGGTQAALGRAVKRARDEQRKVICFITGVPGAGKTLAGLNAVHQFSGVGGRDNAVFLSGNGPLVKLLVESLARDDHVRNKGLRIMDARRKSATFVQNVHRFIELFEQRDTQRPPDERVVVFDEAQRAWNAEHALRKFKRPTSEPVSMLRIMDRHAGWAVLVCLIGGGQEINTGEAGLREWGRALETQFSHWQAWVSPELMAGDASTAGQTLFKHRPGHVEVVSDQALHLSVPMRSYRSQLVGDWVNAVIGFEPERAQRHAEALKYFPVVITRELARAREWLNHRRRGLRRAGLVCSSGARRLRRHGIDPTIELGIEDWFLAGCDDVRSSEFLELPATEFAIQGLELDWVGLCWDADLRANDVDKRWEHWKFVGKDWKRIGVPINQRYLENKYRVLLTRAREGVVIWVPHGDTDDRTRLPRLYDGTAAYLARW
ncbi:MAG: DUF2075 domain-containing protein [Phycisphaera sp.]|nr:DUF2075 domain-containing protein [Phycisphaera sp.]